MTFIIHTGGDAALKKQLKRHAVLQENQPVVFVPDRPSLVEALYNNLAGDATVLYVVADEADLAFLHTLQELFFSMKLIIVLDSNATHFLTAACALQPRLILKRENGDGVITGVFRKLTCFESPSEGNEYEITP